MPSKPKPKPELMSPAGHWAGLRAALAAGADAVYFGLRGLNMRANYRNFTPGELPRIAATCHAAGARAYLALNTIIYENELPKMERTLRAAVDAGIDAVIAWDLAVVRRATALGLPVFLSTQMSAANSESLLELHRTFGIRRFVLARECTLEMLRAIRRRLRRELGANPDGTDVVELEVFAHGAMCVSLSGRCFLSEERFGKSGNRGECLQPCRREYRIVDVEDGRDGDIAYRLGPQYLLSPEDLCTMPFLEQLLDSGVASLKIEGRARTPEYVSTVTAAYRRAIDFWAANRRKAAFREPFAALKKELMAELDGAYHRGLSDGFYMGKPVGQWTTARGSRARQSKQLVGEVANYYRRAGAAEIAVRSHGFALGDELLIQGPTTGLVRVTAESIQVGHEARGAAQKGERVALAVPQQVRVNDRVFVVTRGRASDLPCTPPPPPLGWGESP